MVKVVIKLGLVCQLYSKRSKTASSNSDTLVPHQQLTLLVQLNIVKRFFNNISNAETVLYTTKMILFEKLQIQTIWRLNFIVQKNKYKYGIRLYIEQYKIRWPLYDQNIPSYNYKFYIKPYQFFTHLGRVSLVKNLLMAQKFWPQSGKLFDGLAINNYV